LGFYDDRRILFPGYYQKIGKFLDFFGDRKELLELGCGYGDFLKLLGERKVRGEGVDLDAASVARCRQEGLRVRKGDALKFLRQGAVRFDAIFCSNVVEHLTPESLLELLDLAAARLPQGGKLGICTANPQCLGIHADSFWRDLTHVRFYPLSLLSQLLEERGFKLIAAAPDEDTRPRSLLRNLLRRFRTLLVGNYFGPPEIYILAERR
jgi:SAM-dependent methyltransferase